MSNNDKINSNNLANIRIKQFKQYRNQILRNPFYYDLDLIQDTDIKSTLNNLYKTSIEHYLKFTESFFKINFAKVKSFTPKQYKINHDFKLSNEFMINLNLLKEDISSLRYIAKLDFSTHEVDDIIDALKNQERTRSIASANFAHEFGIFKHEVQKLNFPHKLEEAQKYMKQKINIAIDGVAGAGKSTIAKLLAKKYDYNYIDTGVMYRTIAYLTKVYKIPITDELAIVNEYKKHDISYANNEILIDGVNVSKNIRSPEISRIASIVARHELVRRFFQGMQRKLASKKGVIMDGRDIGSIILPFAELKIYMYAKPEVRAKRRVIQNTTNGYNTKFNKILAEINRRDIADKNRQFGPLIKTPDAIEIDSSDLNIEEVVSQISDLIDQKIAILESKN